MIERNSKSETERDRESKEKDIISLKVTARVP